MIHVDACREQRVAGGVPPERIEALLRDGTQAIWVDVRAPDEADWTRLADAFHFHPLAVEDARKQDQRAKLDVYDGYLFLSVRAWSGTTSPTDDLTDATQEVDLFLGPNYLVTIHNGACPVVEEARQRWEQHPDRGCDRPDFLLYVLLDAIVDAYLPVMDAMDAQIDALETRIYQPTAVLDLSPALQIKKQLLLLRQTAAPMRDVLNQLLRTEAPLVSPGTHVYFQDVYDHALRLVEQVDLHRDILLGVMDAINAQVNNRLNEVMKRLTAITALFLPITAITGFFGMNIGHLDKAPSWALYLTTGTMVAASIGVWRYLQRKGWW